jgi:hypothetical protein
MVPCQPISVPDRHQSAEAMAKCRHADPHRPAARGQRRRPQRVGKADLREVVLGLGYTDVATYIQSGNVVFTSEEADTAMIAAALERAIAEHLGVRPKVVVLTRAELARVVADNPSPRSPIPDGSTRSSGTTAVGEKRLSLADALQIGGDGAFGTVLSPQVPLEGAKQRAEAGAVHGRTMAQ